MKYQITENCELIDLLEKLYPNSSKNKFKLWLKQKRIWIQGRPYSRLNQRVEKGTILELKNRTETIGNVEIVFEDEELIVLDKPPGLLSVDTETKGETNLFKMIKLERPSYRIGVVHRLDRETSGLICFSKEKETLEELKEQLKTKQMSRCYLAFVEGNPAKEEGSWSDKLLEGKDLKVRISRNGSEALTFYRTLALYDQASLLELQLGTGRKHQIRVHCSSVGCPIIGDERYGSSIKGRLGLHAWQLSFFHPKLKRMIELDSPSRCSFEQHFNRVIHSLQGDEE